ncbi:MAG TPA: hypothetical protein VGM20_03885 [Gemmatimonadales bacterium]|jgi:hypothetical protein
MVDFVVGLALVALWIILQFVVRPATGWIHLALGAGMVFIIRGIVASKWGTPRSQ